MYEIELIIDYQETEPTDVLYTLDKCCPIIDLKTEGYSQAHEVKAIEGGGHLLLSGNVFVDIDGGEVANSKLNVLYIKSEPIELYLIEDFVECLIQELPIVQAFVHNHEYTYWQNAEDTLEYESAGKNHSNLIKVSNGLPPPLEQLVIDISNNPGRRIFRTGFKEVVSSPMWVSPRFVKNISQVKRIEGVVVSKVSGLYRVSSQYSPFTTDSGDQKRLQVELRSAIYET